MRPIDADALKDELELADFETDSRMFGGQTVLFEDSVFKIVDSAPTLSPDEVLGVGEWISNHDGSWNCSECGLRVLIYAKGNFCPNCGARMKGVSEDA